MTREPHPRFNIGDVVRIVDTPYHDCPFTWIDEMSDYCGEETTITDVYWNESSKTHGYSLDCDDGCCTWCENCFEPELDIEESDSDPNVLFE